MNNIINFRIVLKVISRNLFIVSAAMFSCTAVALIYSEDVIPFLLSSLTGLITGSLMYLPAGRTAREKPIHKKDTYLIVTISWLMICLLGSLPYLVSGAIPSFIDALFESVSGFTTTGSSILTDIEILPKSILFWRSLTHWIGGIGIIVLVIVIMPSLKIGGYHLFTLESSLQEKIHPKIRNVGYRMLLIYVILTVFEIILLLIGKMNLFESVCHAFGTVATGGFSPKNTSIAGYSPYIQYVIMLFMLLGGTNFLIHFYLFKREMSKVRDNEEVKFYLIVILIIGLIAAGSLFHFMQKPLETAFREGFFQVISIITCTGYATADYLLWPEFLWMILFFAMFFGGSTGSTAGGIKMARHLVLLKNLRNCFRQPLSPHAILPVRLNRKILTGETNNYILTFITVYILVFVIGTTLMIMMDTDIKTAAGSVATCMAGIGPGLGTVGPASNFAHLPGIAKLLLASLMIIGRLEIFTVIIIFTPGFWRR